MYTALAGAVGALYGPLHGGANEVNGRFSLLLFYSIHKNGSPTCLLFYFVLTLSLFLLHGFLKAVLKMLSEIGAVENIPGFLEGVKNRCLFLLLSMLCLSQSS